MDASGLVLTSLGICFKVTSLLYSYGKQVKGARHDIRDLSNEVFGLIGALQHLGIQLGHRSKLQEDPLQPPPYSQSEANDQEASDYQQHGSTKDSYQTIDALVLNQTVKFLQELQKSLEVPKGRWAATAQLLKWPLRESEVQKHLNRLERVKTYFVLSLITGEVDQSRKTADKISSLRTLLEDVSLRQQAADNRKTFLAYAGLELIGLGSEHQGMMEWLCPVDPSVTRKSIQKLQMPGTGTWFTKTKELQRQSISDESSCFWLNGITGAGKSTLLTAAIDDLMKSYDLYHDLAYFYCSFSNAESLYTHSVLGSILSQICLESDPVYLELKSRYADLSSQPFSKSAKLDVDVLCGLIIQQAKRRKHLYIIVDGINECYDPSGLLEALEGILKSASGVQLLVSSINEKKIHQSMLRLPKVHEVTLSPSVVESDVRILVHSALETRPRLKELPQSLKGEIATRLTDGAEGMFRWVQCQLDLLSKLRTPGAVKKALDALPLTLDKTYEGLFGRIDGEEDRFLTKQILQMLAFSFRPLSLDEVSTMLQVTPSMRHLDSSKCLTHPTDILDICGSLLRYNEKNGMVTLAHHSVKTYLTSSARDDASYFRLDKDEAHRFLALNCVAYLSMDAFAQDLNNRRDLLPDDHLALNYATEHWGLHMKELSDPGELLFSQLRYFLLSADHGRHNFINWVRTLIPESPFIQETSPLYYASSYGLTPAVKYLLESGVDTEVPGGRGGATPINIAAFRGNLDVVKVLYEHGADPLKKDRIVNLNAIQWAKDEGRRDVYEYLKAKGYGV